MKLWVIIISMYVAPPESTNWAGPWKFDKPRVIEQTFATEDDCRNYAVQLVGRAHQTFLIPIRFKCVSFEREVKKGEPF